MALLGMLFSLSKRGEVEGKAKVTMNGHYPRFKNFYFYGGAHPKFSAHAHRAGVCPKLPGPATAGGRLAKRAIPCGRTFNQFKFIFVNAHNKHLNEIH
jgi:hypothetical protein